MKADKYKYKHSSTDQGIKMAKENNQNRPSSNAEEEERFSTKRKPWNYPDLFTNFHQNQSRTCCSPADEIEAMGNNEEPSHTTHNVQVQTEKSGLFLWKQDKRSESNAKKNAQEITDNKKMHLLDNANPKNYSAHEADNSKIRKPYLSYEHEKVGAKLATNVSPLDTFDEYAETDLDQPMDYTLCYNETNLDDDKKRNTSYLHKNDFLCIEEAIDEEKGGIIKPKSVFSKEPAKNKKEMFSNTSRSFKEIFNFFKDRDKKRSTTENTKSSSENQKLSKPIVETCEQKFLKCSQSVQSPLELSEKESKSKNETQLSQQTPLMFSRCSSLGSLNGFDQNYVQDDRSSIVSDFSRRTSGVVSPSELPDSPAQIAPLGNKFQPKSQIGCFGKKKLFSPHQDKTKNPTLTNDNTLQSESILRMLPLGKRSVFEDNLTSFKDESTPTKLHSMAASSLSSLTIDDEDEYDIVNKIILNKEKVNYSDETKIENNVQERIRKENIDGTLVKSDKTENFVNDDEEEDLDDERDDELTDLTPYEEQLLDECIRRGIAKWTKRNINEIKPFSWDVGLTCLATRTILNSRIRVNSYSEVDNDTDNIINHNINEALVNNDLNFEKNTQKDKEPSNCKKYSNLDTSPTEEDIDLEATDQFNENSYYVTYEEHLLDQCIRRGMAKITKRHIDDIKPFSWDANQICLTTRAMILHGRDEEIYSCH